MIVEEYNPYEVETKRVKESSFIEAFKGGRGSGNWGHSGRPGKRGGSAPNGKLPKSVLSDESKTLVAGIRNRYQELFDPKKSLYASQIAIDLIRDDMKELVISTTYSNEKYYPVLNSTLGKMAKSDWQMGDYWETASDYERGKVKEKIVSDISQRSGLPDWAVNQCVKQWSHTSNDSDMRSLSLQEAAAEELGAYISPWQQEHIKEVKDHGDEEATRILGYYKEARNRAQNEPGPEDENVAPYSTHVITRAQMRNMSDQELLEKARSTHSQLNPESHALGTREAERKFVRSVYDNTQDHFKKLGYGPDDEIILYRGIWMPMDNRKRKFFNSPAQLGKFVRYRGNTVESWSLSSKVAHNFDSFVIAKRVKIKDIYSTAVTGIGCLTEGEVVIINREPQSIAEVVSVKV